MSILCAYITDNSEWESDDPHFSMLTHINYAFAHVEDKHGTVVEHFAKADDLQKIKENFPSIKISLSIGGWGAGNFSEAAENAENRRSFVKSALTIVDKYQFDGLDIDWEYPCIPGGGISCHPDDKRNFTLLLSDLRNALNKKGYSDGKDYLLTIAAGAQKEILNVMEIEKILKSLNWIYLMNYDFGSVASVTGHHAPLYYSQKTPGRWNADQSIQAFLEANVPPSKLVFGFPFYGRGWSGVESKGDGLNCRVYGSKGHYFDYKKIITELLPSSKFAESWDEEAKAAYLFDGDTFITYENPRSIKIKVKYLQDRNLAGAMFWDYSLDYKGELLTTLFKSLDLFPVS